MIVDGEQENAATAKAEEPKKVQPEVQAASEVSAGEPPRRSRGFATMDRAKIQELARKGGLSAHRKGTAHRFTSEEARIAGRKGGSALHRTRGRRTAAAQQQ